MLIRTLLRSKTLESAQIRTNCVSLTKPKATQPLALNKPRSITFNIRRTSKGKVRFEWETRLRDKCRLYRTALRRCVVMHHVTECPAGTTGRGKRLTSENQEAWSTC
jgi:hypothetical protein